MSKLLEQVVHLHVSEFVESSLSNLQHGFRKRRSCVTQLLGVFHAVGKALDSGKEADMDYLDFSKAFDSVSHRNLLLKLEQHGISGSLLNWFSDYLSERRQHVVVDGVSSSFLTVPQGSVLGPLLFLIYANNLPKAANHSTVPMFADDRKCYRQITQPRDRYLLQDDLNSLRQWSMTWDLNFNAKKCVALRFSRKKTSVPPQDYFLNQQLIKSSSTQSDLTSSISFLKPTECLDFCAAIVSTSLTWMLAAFCICLCSALTYRSAAKSGLLKERLLICFISKEFNTEQQSLFFRTMNCRTLVA